MHAPKVSDGNEQHMHTIFLGVTELVDKREWDHAVHKFPRLEILVRRAIEECLKKERHVEAVHALVARTQMNTEYSVKIVGRRLEQFFQHTFGIPTLHSLDTKDDDFRLQRTEPTFNVHDHDEDEHEPPIVTHDEDDHDHEHDQDEDWSKAAA